MTDKEFTVWKYNKSGRIPHRVLVDMAENDNLSFEAIGMFITLYLTGEIKPEPQRLRISKTSSAAIDELRKHNLLVSDTILDMLDEQETERS